MKNIIALIVILLVAGGIYFFFFQGGLGSGIEDISVPDLNFEISDLDLGNLNASSLNIDIPLPGNLFPDISIDTDFSGYEANTEFEVPQISAETPTGNYQATDEICQQFESVPSCMFVPEEHRDLCNQCKGK